MHKTVYICDICKKEKPSAEIKTLEIKSQDINFNGSSYGKSFEICTDCLKDKGFVFDSKICSSREQQQANTHALEDKIIDILSDLGVQFYE